MGTRQPPSTPSSSKGTVWVTAWPRRFAARARVRPRQGPCEYFGSRALPRCAGVAHGGTGPHGAAEQHGAAELISITPPAPHTGPPTPSAAPPWAVGTVE